MTSDQFTYWLQGFTELHGEPPTAEQWQSIKDHLSLVFKKVTPPLQPAQRVRDLLARPLEGGYLGGALIGKADERSLSIC